MQIGQLWRYPVKSMRGEQITEATLHKNGMPGDRSNVVVSQSRDRIITARTHPGLLGLQASVSPEGFALIEGRLWHSPEEHGLASRAAGETVHLVDVGDDSQRFDVLPLLVATDGAINELGLDLRRLRQNVVVGGGHRSGRKKLARIYASHW